MEYGFIQLGINSLRQAAALVVLQLGLIVARVSLHSLEEPMRFLLCPGTAGSIAAVCSIT